MKYAEIIHATGQLTKLRDAHRQAATDFLKLFNRNRIPGSDIHSPMSPLLSFYQLQTEYHSIRSFDLDEVIASYQRAIDATIFE